MDKLKITNKDDLYIKHKKIFLCLTSSLFILAFIIILICGDEYTFEINDIDNINDISDINISIDEEGDVDNNVIEVYSQKYENNTLIVKIKSLNKGKTYLEIRDKEDTYFNIYPVYVHSFGIITVDNFLGNCTGSIIFPIATIICLVYLQYILIYKYNKEKKENMYQYKNIYSLGLIIFLTFIIINQIMLLFNYNGVINSIKRINNTSSMFSIILLPIFLVTSILVTISNIRLMIKEGRSLKNGLGTILGLFLIFMSIFPLILGEYLQNATWVDVHFENGIAMHVELFLDQIIYSFIAYLECMLIGTIVYGIKSALFMPEYNKDYIIILGCQIKKDGTLTNLLKSRVDKAIEFRNKQLELTGKDLIFVTSGGKGNDEIISEGEAMKNYLLSSGVSEENIIVENKSVNTYENFKFSLNKIKEKNGNCNIAFSTTNYHVFRSGVIANSMYKNIDGMGAPTKRYFWINAFFREFAAILMVEIKKNIKIFSIIFVMNFLMVLIVYLSKIL